VRRDDKTDQDDPEVVDIEKPRAALLSCSFLSSHRTGFQPAMLFIRVLFLSRALRTVPELLKIPWPVGKKEDIPAARSRQ
jgi:hypothetical protein